MADITATAPTPIIVFRGDDSEFRGNRDIIIKLETEMDLSGVKAHFYCLGYRIDFDEIPASRELKIPFPSSITKKFPLGPMNGQLWLEDDEGCTRTVANRIMIVVTDSVMAAYNGQDPQAISYIITNGDVKWEEIKGKPDFAAVATSGSYNDLSDKPEGVTLDDSVTETSPNGVKSSGIWSWVMGLINSVLDTISGHTQNKNNPHGVTCEQIDAAPSSALLPLAEDITNHKDNKSNPHGVTAGQVGAYTESEVDAKLDGYVKNTSLDCAAMVWHLFLAPAQYTYEAPWDSSQNKWVSSGPSVWIGDDGLFHTDLESGDTSFEGFEYEFADGSRVTTDPIRGEYVASDSKKLGGSPASEYAKKDEIPDVSRKVDKVTGFGVAAIGTPSSYGAFNLKVQKDDGTQQTVGLYNKDALDKTVSSLNTAIAAKASTTSLTSHTGNKSNPHGVTAEQVGAYTKAEVDGKVGAIRNVTHNVTRSCSAWKLDVVSESKPDNSITGEAVSYEFTTSNSTEEGIVRVYSNYWVIDANPSHKSHILIEMHESADGLAYIHIYLCVNGDSVDHIISGSELQYFEHYYSLPLDLIDWGKDGWGCGFESSGVFGMAVRICNTTESVTEAEAVVGDLRYTAEQGVLRYDDAALMYCVGVKDRTNTLVDIPITFNDFIIALEMPVLGDIKYGVTKVFDALVTIKITDGVTVPSFSMLDTNGESIPCFYSKDTTDLLNELVGTIPEGGITLTMSITRDVSKPNSLMVSVVKNHVDWY